jgi:EAL domain-containing protein (putative c-di-GMP-specific phosphodiesterase class I)
VAQLACDIAQGYAIARPMPVEDFLHWLDKPQHPPLHPERSARR